MLRSRKETIHIWGSTPIEEISSCIAGVAGNIFTGAPPNAQRFPIGFDKQAAGFNTLGAQIAKGWLGGGWVRGGFESP